MCLVLKFLRGAREQYKERFKLVLEDLLVLQKEDFKETSNERRSNYILTLQRIN